VDTMKTGKNILLTGATGYVGGRLLRALEQAGYTVRCLARKPEYLKQRIGSTTEVVQGDCLVPSSLESAMQGIDAAYYMVHSMGSSGDFEDLDRQAAANFGQAAKNAGVRRIIYLGGLGESSEGLSAHLRSRQETGETLRSCGVPVVELRASIVLGSGSLSFELIRALVERLPVMICPSWVQVKAQPIAIEDVVAYLVQSLDLPDAGSQVFEIGGADQVSYAEIMREYARQRSLRRLFIPVPVLTPRLSSLWLGLTTPVYARVGRKLIEGVRNPTVVTNNDAMSAFDIRPMNLSAAIARAMRNEDQKFAMTRWSDSISSGSRPKSWGGTKFGSRLVDSRTMNTVVSPDRAFEPVRKLGGRNGWYYANWLWRLRGFIDLLVGGVGMRRGRRDPDDLKVGDALDFWRVEAYEPDRLLRLAAEMKLPGRAWLEYEVRSTDQGSEIRQTAVFDPVGLFGLIYWYGIYPLHSRIFGGMLRAVARRAEEIRST
jgi:uncharacterized protein YbjT (DUF2867 family)